MFQELLEKQKDQKVKEEVWTVELNLDAESFNDVCAWHIDTLKGIIETNLELAVSGRKSNNWVIVGVTTSHEAAHEFSKKLANVLGGL